MVCCMAQLLVRNLEEELVRRLKKQAGENGISAEEEHRRILWNALMEEESTEPVTFKEHLLSMPDTEDETLFSGK